MWHARISGLDVMGSQPVTDLKSSWTRCRHTTMAHTYAKGRCRKTVNSTNHGGQQQVSHFHLLSLSSIKLYSPSSSLIQLQLGYRPRNCLSSYWPYSHCCIHQPSTSSRKDSYSQESPCLIAQQQLLEYNQPIQNSSSS